MLSHISLLILFVFTLTGCAGNQEATKKKTEALQQVGTSLVQQGNLRAGLEKLLEAVKLDPTNSAIHHELALVYRDLGEFQISLDHFKKTLALRPEFPQAWNNMGTVYLLLRQWDQAINCFQMAVGDILYRTPHYAYNNLGFAYLKKEQYQKAIVNFKKALKFAPSFTPAQTNLGLALERMNRWEEAVNTYKKAISMDPEYPAAHFHLGRLYMKINRNAQAAEELHQVIKLDPRGQLAQESRKFLDSMH
jgi:type IV pilus biogenesis/stability protein PilW